MEALAYVLLALAGVWGLVCAGDPILPVDGWGRLVLWALLGLPLCGAAAWLLLAAPQG